MGFCNYWVILAAVVIGIIFLGLWLTKGHNKSLESLAKGIEGEFVNPLISLATPSHVRVIKNKVEMRIFLGVASQHIPAYLVIQCMTPMGFKLSIIRKESVGNVALGMVTGRGPLIVLFGWLFRKVSSSKVDIVDPFFNDFDVGCHWALQNRPPVGSSKPASVFLRSV